MAQSHEEEFAALAWELEAHRMLDEYIAENRLFYDYYAYANPDSSTGAYNDIVVNYYDFDDWLRDNYPIDRIPTILALAKNPFFEEWKYNLSWSETDEFDWDEWAINWMMQLYYGSLAFEYFDYWENGHDFNGAADGRDVSDVIPWAWVGGSRDNTKDRAFLIAGTTASVLLASKMTGLDVRDAHLWLLDADNKGVDGNNPIVPGNIYSVPNSVLIGIGEAWALPRQYFVLWTATISDAASDKGFAVRLIRQHDGDSGDKFNNWATHKDTWGLYMFGHGLVDFSWFSVDLTYPYNGCFEWDDHHFYCADDLNGALIFSGNSNRHRYGLLVAYFCYANYNKWNLLVSNEGSYYGGNGSVFVGSGPRSVSWWMTWRAMFNDAAKVK